MAGNCGIEWKPPSPGQCNHTFAAQALRTHLSLRHTRLSVSCTATWTRISMKIPKAQQSNAQLLPFCHTRTWARGPRLDF